MDDAIAGKTRGVALLIKYSSLQQQIITKWLQVDPLTIPQSEDIKKVVDRKLWQWHGLTIFEIMELV